MSALCVCFKKWKHFWSENKFCASAFSTEEIMMHFAVPDKKKLKTSQTVCEKLRLSDTHIHLSEGDKEIKTFKSGII